ncbi:hypothetical protein [Limobrevibacterium gyesilva]|uniref:Outer membrane protein n=1 Tax=Limobrevibacterium gyesilva TaxID=2991712 RepID=A0AA41YM04_9PROT|nr:hypothetical protein [Limobrevibacterium gyesilva]MCW3474772.1 hypothetical protein [Limobrevibacterium gyesilva]
MCARTILAAVTALGALTAASARAQIATTQPTLDSKPGWTFAVTPYVWLPSLSAKLNYNTPRAGSVTTTISAGPGDYLSKLNFALMGGAEARHDRFIIMTDLVYANASLTTSNSHFASFNPGSGPIFIPREQQLDTGSRLAATVWSVAGGYTLLQGGWGNVDAVVGMRMLVVGDTTNYTLTNDIFLPNRTIGLSRTGSLNLNDVNVEGVGGVKGRINIPNSRFYVPFYADVGGGGLPLTWQVYASIAYRAANWVDLSAGYRYLAFETGGNKGVHNLDLGGAILVANFRF